MTELHLPLVLMADDDEDDCLMATMAFEDNGARINFACVPDGKALIERLNECRRSGNGLPKLILVDLNMPHVNGPEVLTVIKKDQALRNIPAVILTTSSKGEVRSGIKDMADGFFTKPHSLEGWLEMMKFLAERWL